MKAERIEKESEFDSKMASSCCGTKKQRMDGEPCNHTIQYGKMNGHSLTNGSGLTNGLSNGLTNGHSAQNGHCTQNGHGAQNGHGTQNGHGAQNGYSVVEQVSSQDMCFFCFEVLYRELHRLDGPTKPSFTDDA